MAGVIGNPRIEDIVHHAQKGVRGFLDGCWKLDEDGTTLPGFIESKAVSANCRGSAFSWPGVLCRLNKVSIDTGGDSEREVAVPGCNVVDLLFKRR